MGLVHRTLVAICLLLVVTSPVAGAVTAVSTGTPDGENGSVRDGALLTGVVGTVGTIGGATTDTLGNTTDALLENASGGADSNASGDVTDTAGAVAGNATDGVENVTANVEGSSTDAVEAVTEVAGSATADMNSETATDGASGTVTDDVVPVAREGAGVAADDDASGEATTEGLGAVTTALVREDSTAIVENATYELVRLPENETGEFGREVLVVGGGEPVEELGLQGADRSAIPGASTLRAGADRGSLVRSELPRLALTDSAMVFEVRTVDAGGLSTVTVPLDAVDTQRSLLDDGSSGGAIDPATPTEPPVETDEDERASTPTPTPSEGNASVTAGGTADAGGESASNDGALGLDLKSPFEFAPPLGTTLFVVAARPWLGVLSGAASMAANWVGRAFFVLRYGRHDGSDPLEHETRDRIHDLVDESPGRTLTQLSDELDTPLSTIRHHVRVLERERVIVTRKQRGNRRIYPLGAENAELAAALEEESSAAVIAALHEQGRATVGDVVDRVEKSYGTVSYHLSRLVDEGLVVQERDGREKVSRLDPAVESLLESPGEQAQADVDRRGTEASAD